MKFFIILLFLVNSIFAELAIVLKNECASIRGYNCGAVVRIIRTNEIKNLPVIPYVQKGDTININFLQFNRFALARR